MTLRGLTYHPGAPHSWAKDLVLSELRLNAPDGARERLERHAQEMRVVTARAEGRRWREFRAAASALGLEYRVEPNTTQGTGGYFAPPLWVNQLFATANRPHRTLSGLIPASFPLPAGVSSINLPIMTTGTLVGAAPPAIAVVDQDVQDSSGSSSVCTLVGDSDVSIQELEQSPASAAVDELFLMDLSEALDYQVEQQCLYGSGTNGNIAGVVNATGLQTKTYTSASPTGGGLWPYMGQLGAAIGDNRLQRPEAWFMRSARWGWLLASEDSTGLPFGILSPNFLGSTLDTPDPIGGLYGLPVFTDDAIPATCTFSTSASGFNGSLIGGTQDLIFCLRPSDMVFFEGAPKLNVYRQPGSGNLSARIQLHNSIAAILNRRPAGIGVLGGTGLSVAAGY